jgi:protein TonB
MPSSKELAENKKNSLPDNKQIKKKSQTQVKEATISLDTDDEIYAPYASVIKERIFYHWVYPLSAQNSNMQGDLLIALRLDNNGNLIECSVTKPSKYKILDEHALKAINLANPFPPFPENIGLDFLNINASFSYQLNFK